MPRTKPSRGGWSLIVGLLVLLVSVGVAPAVATSADAGEEFEGAFGAFELHGSNGYRVLVFADSKREDGVGHLLLIAANRPSAVLYSAAATVTPTAIVADLGALGEIDLEYVPGQGREKPRCGEGDGYPRGSYRGSFEFRGEQGYTRVSATRIRARNRLFGELICGGVTRSASIGGLLPGARLSAASTRRGRSRLSFEVWKNHPAARALFEVRLTESRGGVTILRGTEALLGAATFRYEPELSRAVVDPPAPFSGTAVFHRVAEPGSHWVGNLRVDLPGRRNLALTGPRIGSSLVRARWDREQSSGDRRSLLGLAPLP